MSVAIYGGSFNPPHKGHTAALKAAAEQLRPDRLIVMPAGDPPHKNLPADSPSGTDRLKLTRLAVSEIPGAEVSEMELLRAGPSYTSDTLRSIKAMYPGETVWLLMGTDMFLSVENWHESSYILGNSVIAVFCREEGQTELVKRHAEELKSFCGADTVFIESEPIPAASSAIRALLPERKGAELLDDEVYAEIIRRRLYGAKPDFEWLRGKAYAMLKPKRVPHVRGCEAECIRLAERWGADTEKAAEAGILHDITKKLLLDEQLILCKKYGIINDTAEIESPKLLHAKTGAAVARAEFGVDEDVYNAILWHTTGREGMTLLEKVVYLGDYIEPTREFDGVDALRRLAYESIDDAMILGLEMSLDDIRSYGAEPHERTVRALDWFTKRKKGQI